MTSICKAYLMIIQSSKSFKENNESCSWIILIMAVPTALINLSMLIAIGSLTERRKPCELLLISLATTDLIVGFYSMPAFFLTFRYISEEKNPCFFAQYSYPTLLVLSSVSLITVSIIAWERYISIFHPYYHMLKLSSRKLLIFIFLSWIIPILAMVLSYTLRIATIFRLFGYVVTLVGAIANLLAYSRIIAKARRVRAQIHSEQSRYGHVVIRARDKNLVYIGGLITFSILICYTPAGAVMFLTSFGYNTKKYRQALCWAWRLMMMNSLLNPIITCCFCSYIRAKVLRILTYPFKR